MSIVEVDDISLKYDAAKLPMDLWSPLVKEAVAEVLQHGAIKYGRWNWIKSGFTVSRLRAALDRHLNEFDKGVDIDPEFELQHLAHAMCMLMFLLHQQLLPDVYGHLDDRPDFQTKEVKSSE